MIDWNTPKTHVFYPPAAPAPLDVQGCTSSPYLWFQTSGTSGRPKWVALSYSSFLSSAAAVNEHLGVQSGETWINVLPVYHVGGQAIYARAFLTSSAVEDISDQRWDVSFFVESLERTKAGWTSLVPTQVYDLVLAEVHPPSTLRGVVVGGGHLADPLFDKAISLGWPIHVSYGMTEVGSQVATSRVGERELRVLKHLEIRCEERIWIRGASLLDGYYDGVWIPRQGDWYETKDVGQLKNGILQIQGRVDHVRKVRGHLVSLDDVFQRLTGAYPELVKHANLVFESDERLENRIVLRVETGTYSREELNAHLPQAFKISRVDNAVPIQRTALGKPIKS